MNKEIDIMQMSQLRLITLIFIFLLFLGISDSQDEEPGANAESVGPMSGISGSIGSTAESMSVVMPAGDVYPGGGGHSHSDVVINPGDVYIDKFTDKYIYNKGDLIKVILKVHAIEPRSGLKYSDNDIYIYEELFSLDANGLQSNDYKLVRTAPNYQSFESGEIIWHFSDLKNLMNTKRIEYVIKTNKSGYHMLGNSRLESKEKIVFVGSRPVFNIIDHPPIINNTTYPSACIWRGDTNYIGANVTDIDSDNVTCELYYNGRLIPKLSRTPFLKSCRYTWDLSGCSPGIHIFKITADDGNNTIETEGTVIEIRDRMFNILPYPDEYKVPVFTGVATGLILSGLLGTIKRSRKFFKNIDGELDLK